MYFYTYGNYFKDYQVIFSLIPSSSKKVIEVCFGDIYLANICRQNQIDWTGYDISNFFVENAKKRNFNAIKANLHDCNIDTACDAIIISRSLYHFKDTLDKHFLKKDRKIFSANVDCDLYEGYKKCLPIIFKSLEVGGFVNLDEYYSLKYPGAKIATDEFLLKNKNAVLSSSATRKGEFPRYHLTKK